MANPFFRFKQFVVYQDRCAMKVCTDACIFGAWAASHLGNSQRILDVGAGTGLLSLMLAQVMPADATIDAVEIDRSAAMQATGNFSGSAWKNRLRLHHMPIQQYRPPEGVLYDFIITNPPFFENDLPSNDNKRNLALHSAALTLQEMLAAVVPLLKQDGRLAVLLPYHRTKNFIAAAAQAGLYPVLSSGVKQTFLHSHFRSMMLFSRQPEPISRNYSVVIRDAAGNYSQAFNELLEDYYLYL